MSSEPEVAPEAPAREPHSLLVRSLWLMDAAGEPVAVLLDVPTPGGGHSHRLGGVVWGHYSVPFTWLFGEMATWSLTDCDHAQYVAVMGEMGSLTLGFASLRHTHHVMNLRWVTAAEDPDGIEGWGARLPEWDEAAPMMLRDEPDEAVEAAVLDAVVELCPAESDPEIPVPRPALVMPMDPLAAWLAAMPSDVEDEP